MQRAGFGLLPAIYDVPAEDPSPAPVALYLPPADDAILDGGFEPATLSAWRTLGAVAPAITTTAHTGKSAVWLSGTNSLLGQTITFSPTMPPSLTLSLMYQIVTGNPVSDTLSVTFSHNINVVTYTLPLTNSGWTHLWWELPAWDVPTGTLQIELISGEAAQPASVIFDEISLGSAAIGVYPFYLPVVAR